MALEDRRVCPASRGRSAGAVMAGRASRSPARPFCSMPSRDLATPSSSSAMRRCWPGRGAKVICEVQPELQPLLSQLDGVTVIASGEPLPAFDLHCPLLSLPLAFKTQPETIPAAIPYLAAPAERVAYWRDRLPPGGPRAGFVWSGSAVAQERRQPVDRAGASRRVV